MASDPTQRFTDRVEYYIRYRPRYPAAVRTLLENELGLTPAAAIADVGSGTGILAELLLENGNLVYGVEPNEEMRAAAERLLSAYANFRSISGRSEMTTLADHSVDLITAGQAFHWFDPEPTRTEFRRILRPGGYVVLVWNERSEDGTPFMAAYEAFLQRYGTDYADLQRQDITEKTLTDFFAPTGYQIREFGNSQRFDLAGLTGRFLSSSYAPLPGHASYEESLTELRRLFAKHQESGSVTFVYATQVFFGTLPPLAAATVNS